MSPAKRIRVYTYRFLVVASEHPEIPVGTPMVDARRSDPMVWDFLHDGEILSVVGKRGPRCCSECHAIGLVRDYGHDGDHGESAPYTVWPTDEEIEAVMAGVGG